MKKIISLALSSLLILNYTFLLNAQAFNGFELGGFDSYLDKNIENIGDGFDTNGIDSITNDIFSGDNNTTSTNMDFADYNDFDIMNSYMNTAMDNTIDFFETSDLVASGMMPNADLITVKYKEMETSENNSFSDMNNSNDNDFLDDYNNLSEFGNAIDLDSLIENDIMDYTNENQFDQFENIAINDLEFLEDMSSMYQQKLMEEDQNSKNIDDKNSQDILVDSSDLNDLSNTNDDSLSNNNLPSENINIPSVNLDQELF